VGLAVLRVTTGVARNICNFTSDSFESGRILNVFGKDKLVCFERL